MADKELIRISYTPEHPFMLEAAFITEILERGWDMVHLRHPAASLREMQAIVEAIPQKYHSKLRLHGHFSLLDHFNLGGVQLNSRCPVLPTSYNGPHSRSCHTLDEVRASADCDYVTLSPIFDSISKPGYRSALVEKFLKGADKLPLTDVTTPVIALGGVDYSRIRQVRELGFSGYAVLGALINVESLDDLKKRLDLFDLHRND